MKSLAVYSTVFHLTYGAFKEPIDIGYGFGVQTIYWPGMPAFDLSDVEHTTKPYMLAKRFDDAEHGGTHLDAPYHFNPRGWSVAEIPLDRLLVPGMTLLQTVKLTKRDPDPSLKEM